MATVYFLDDTDTAPNISAPAQAEAHTVWVLNPLGLEETIFGSRKPAGVFPHDHSERRGEPLWAPFWYVSFGPYGAEGGAANSWTMGIPVYPPAANNDFTVQPKCLGWWPFRIPAQVKTCIVEFLIWMNGLNNQTVTLKARIRPLVELGYNRDQGNAPSSSVVCTHTTALGDRATRYQWSFADLTPLGDPGLDKEDLVLEIWQTTNAVAASTYRLVAATAVATTYTQGSGEPIETTPARAEVIPAEIKTGERVFSDIAQRAHLRYNQLSLEALGRSPGLQSNLDALSEEDSYQTIVYGPHQHRARRYLDPITGLAVYDGAVQKRLLWLCAPYVKYWDTAGAVTDDPALGLKLHSGGSGATQMMLGGRVSLPIGQQAIFIRFAVLSDNDEELSRLYFYVMLEDINGGVIDLSVNAQGQYPHSARDGNFTVIDVLPIDSPLWQPTSQRLNNGLGVWTQDAAKAPAPSGIIPDATALVPRVSRMVTIGFSLTKVDGPYWLRTKWALEAGVRGSGTFDPLARLAFAVASVPAGY